MEIRWSPDAASDLEGIVEYIGRDDPESARHVAQTIHRRITTLATFPFIGRVRQLAGVVEIVNIIHGAQRWPPTALL